MSNWGKLNIEDDKKFNELFDKYVPGSGNCATLGGEILRAITRIIYRYYNDGDTVDRYYGSDYNCLKGANTFLLNNVKGYVSLENVYEFDYEEAICKRLKYILDYVINNPSVFETPNDDDFLNYQVYEPYNDDYEDDWEDEEEYEDY